MFYKGEICNSLARFVRQKSIYTINSYKSAYVFGTNHKYDELWDYVDDEYTDNPDNDYYQFGDDPEDFEEIFEPVYDVIHINNNKFMFTENVNKTQYTPSDSFEEYLILLHIKDSIDAEKSVDFETVTSHTDSQFYQDGIKIPFDLESLIPFGFFKIVCNCTADSRTVLNVTRHSASEIPNDITSWLNSTGINIQKNIMQGIKDMIAAVNLTADFKALKFQNHQGLMSDLCKDSIRRFI